MSPPRETSTQRKDEEARIVLASVDDSRTEIVKLTQDLIRFKTENPLPLGAETVSGVFREEIACQDYIIDNIRDLGLDLDVWDIQGGHRNLVAKMKGRGLEGRSLVLNGHIDTVQVGEKCDWQFNPWSGDAKEGRVFGRGAADMKGGVSAMISAVRKIHESGIKLDGDVLLEIVADEEMGGMGTRECIRRGYVSDAALFAEATDLRIVPIEPGLVHLRIEVSGKGAHSSTRYKSIHAGGGGNGVNAIEKAVKIMLALRELEQHWANIKKHPYLPAGLNYLHPGIIIGGPGGGQGGLLHSITQPGTVPNYCSLEYELKFYPDERIENLRIEFEDYVNKICAADPWLRDHPPRITWQIRDIYFPPVSTPIEHPFVQMVKHNHESLGSSATVSGFEAVTDMAWYAMARVPSISYGPGETSLAHSTNESVKVDDVIYATKVIALTILGWCRA